MTDAVKITFLLLIGAWSGGYAPPASAMGCATLLGELRSRSAAENVAESAAYLRDRLRDATVSARNSAHQQRRVVTDEHTLQFVIDADRGPLRAEAAQRLTDHAVLQRSTLLSIDGPDSPLIEAFTGRARTELSAVYRFLNETPPDPVSHPEFELYLGQYAWSLAAVVAAEKRTAGGEIPERTLHKARHGLRHILWVMRHLNFSPTLAQAIHESLNRFLGEHAYPLSMFHGMWNHPPHK